jgi:hypothetical protein
MSDPVYFTDAAGLQYRVFDARMQQGAMLVAAAHEASTVLRPRRQPVAVAAQLRRRRSALLEAVGAILRASHPHEERATRAAHLVLRVSPDLDAGRAEAGVALHALRTPLAAQLPRLDRREDTDLHFHQALRDQDLVWVVAWFGDAVTPQATLPFPADGVLRDYHLAIAPSADQRLGARELDRGRHRLLPRSARDGSGTVRKTKTRPFAGLLVA